MIFKFKPINSIHKDVYIVKEYVCLRILLKIITSCHSLQVLLLSSQIVITMCFVIINSLTQPLLNNYDVWWLSISKRSVIAFFKYKMGMRRLPESSFTNRYYLRLGQGLISNYICSFMWVVITHPCRNFFMLEHGCVYILHNYWCNYLSLGIKA